MIIIIDTCELFNYWFLDSSTIKTTSNYASIMLPAVVIDELKSHYKKQVEQHYVNFRKAKDGLLKFQLKKHCGFFPIDAQMFDFATVEDKCKEHSCSECNAEYQFIKEERRCKSKDNTEQLWMELYCIKSVDALIDEYNEYLEQQIKLDKIRVIEYPEISHSKVVENALKGTRPFSIDGKKGYRDFLIWQSVLAVSANYPKEVIHFISSNTSDFSDGKEGFHKDLLHQIPESKAITYWNSLDSFFSKIIQPILDSNTSFNNSDEKINLITQIENNTELLESIKEMVFEKAIGLDYCGGEISDILDDGFEDEHIEIDVSKLSVNDEYLLKMIIPAFCEIKQKIHKNEYDSYPAKWKRQLNMVELYNEDSCAVVSDEVEIDFHIQMIFRSSNNSFEGFEIKEIIAEYGGCDYCPDYDEYDDEDDEEEDTAQ